MTYKNNFKYKTIDINAITVAEIKDNEHEHFNC